MKSICCDASGNKMVQDREKGVYVAGAKEHPVETEDELLQVMQVRPPSGYILTNIEVPCLSIRTARKWREGREIGAIFQ